MMNLLRIDLSSESIKVSIIGDEVIKYWLGGRGLGIYLFLKEVDPTIDPLSEKNKLMLLTGPLTGILGIPASGKITSVTKSPKTNRFHWSIGGGNFGPYLRFSGYDGIILEGKAEKPVWVFVKEDEIEIRDAKDLWGKDVYETVEILKKQLKSEGYSENSLSIAAIGPAGENLVSYASIMIDKDSAIGRGGHGAIMGHKNVKAIVIYAKEKTLPVYDKKDVQNAIVEIIKKIRQNQIIRELTELGTLGMLVGRFGSQKKIPIKNLTEHIKLDTDKIIDEWRKSIDHTKSSELKCWRCIIACKKYVKIKKYKGHAPEYWGGFVSLGTLLGILDQEKTAELYQIVNRLGLDASSTGCVIATFIELVRKGKVKYMIDWGDYGTIRKLIYEIAYKRGIGKELAEGSGYVAKKYGYPETAIVVRNMEGSICDPKIAQGFGLALATSNRGDHQQNMLRDEVLLMKLDPASTKNKANYVVHMQNLFVVTDSSVVCIFTTYELDFNDFAKLFSAVTGISFTANDLYKNANIIYSAERYFNILAKNTEEDILPPRISPYIALNEMLPEYYKLRGWENGKPKKNIIKEIKRRLV